jgi:photosystem II stability/assembly factor-like uncharacterized protein
MKAKSLFSYKSGRGHPGAVSALIILLVLGLSTLAAACGGAGTTTSTANATSTTQAVTPTTQAAISSQTLTSINIVTGAPTAATTSPVMHWERLPLTEDSGPIASLVMDSANPSVLYAGTNEGLFKSSDGAESWGQLPTPVGGVYAISVDPASPSTVYAAVDFATDDVRPTHLLRSDDGGATWADLTDSSALKIGGYAPADVWFDTTSNPSTAYMRRFGDYQVCRSTDRGETWTELTTAEQDQAVALQEAARSKPDAAQQALAAFLASNRYYNGSLVALTDAVFADANAVIVDPDHPSTFYAPATGDVVGADGVYKSVDGGKTWRKASAGLVDSVVWGVVADPSGPSTFYAATPGGIIKSSDGGGTWSMSLVGPVGRSSVVIAPSSPSTLYAWNAAGLFRTDDGGANWDPRGGAYPFNGAVSAAVWLVLVAADNPDIVFAMTDRPFRSANGGSSWYQVFGGTDSASGKGLLVADPNDPSTLFAALPGSCAVLKSTDAGATWTALPMQWNDPVVDIAIDARTPSAVYVIKYRAILRAYSLSRSLDGGATWQKVDLAGAATHLSRLIFDRRSPDTMYAITDMGSASAALYRSTDGGSTWMDITGELAETLAQSTELELVIDPASSEGLYVATPKGLFKWVPGGN